MTNEEEEWIVTDKIKNNILQLFVKIRKAHIEYPEPFLTHREAVFLENCGDKKEAIELYNSLIANYPTYWAAYIARAWFYKQSNEPVAAKNLLKLVTDYIAKIENPSAHETKYGLLAKRMLMNMKDELDQLRVHIPKIPAFIKEHSVYSADQKTSKKSNNENEKRNRFGYW